jgi:hypothetical protein
MTVEWQVILGRALVSLALTTTAFGVPQALSAPRRAPSERPGAEHKRPEGVRSGKSSHDGMRPPAHRPETKPVAACEILIIQGLDQPGPLPKSLSPLRSQLESRPFTRFRSFRLLGRRSVALVSGERRRASLVGPYVLEAELLAQVTSPSGLDRLRFVLTLDKLNKQQRSPKRVLKSVLVLDRGGTLFLAGPRYERGTLVLGLSCR